MTIDLAKVTATYRGLEGCACGCRGTYARSGRALTQRVKAMNTALETPGAVQVYHDGELEDIYELSYVGGRVLRVYVSKEA